MSEFPIWGKEGIDPNAVEQMNDAMTAPPVVAGALMPDAHFGYGVPIGAVVAAHNAIFPSFVGVDIACRMKLSIFDIDADELTHNKGEFANNLESSTFFGVGVENTRRYDHPVLHEDWGITSITKDVFERAKKQLGTSGSGNHFVEFGIVNGKVAVMSHSGSRGAGSNVCQHYMRIAKAMHPEGGDLAWLDLDTAEGQEYWAAMNLMGRYASACHDMVHTSISKNLGVEPIEVIENHHNFAWKEEHGGRELIVHRKGATPAGLGVKGIIPGTLCSPAYIVEGKGEASSLCSASHGAGRLMSRKQAKKTFNLKQELAEMEGMGVTVLSCGADELRGSYKSIDEVMASQKDLVTIIGRFDPKIVKMCGSNDRAED